MAHDLVIVLDGATDNPFDIKGANSAIGNLSELETSEKGNLVNAINELYDNKVTGAGMTLSLVNGIATLTY